MKRFNKYIQIAIEAAKTNPSRFRLAAVAVNRQGKVCAIGVNSSKTHPRQARLAKQYGHQDQIGLHAELSALIKSREKIHSLIVVRLLNDGRLAMAKPCAICSEAIRVAGVRNVVFGNEYGSFTWEKR